MELERFVVALARRWWVIAVFALVGALVGQSAESARADVFTATATILTAPDLDVFGSETVLNRVVLNEMAKIGRQELRQEVIDLFGDDAELDLSVQQETDTDLVNVSVSSSNEEVAIQAANFWAETYVAEVREIERSDLDEQLAAVNRDLGNARVQQLVLDGQLRETVIIREEGLVSTYLETVLREPQLWDELVKIDQDINLLVRQRAVARFELTRILDTSIVSAAVGPIEPTRTGNGLGQLQGIVIGLSLAAALIGVTARDRVSHRALDQVSDSVWPTSVRLARSAIRMPWRTRRIKRDVTSIGTQILSRLPDTRLQVVSFAGVDRKRTQFLKTALADDLKERGYSVSLMTDDTEPSGSPSVDGILDLLNAQESVIFADHEDLLSKRFAGRIVTVVSIDEHRDREDLAVQQISKSLEVSNSVLTVVAK